jgi:hypothetical protein
MQDMHTAAGYEVMPWIIIRWLASCVAVQAGYAADAEDGSGKTVTQLLQEGYRR